MPILRPASILLLALALSMQAAGQTPPATYRIAGHVVSASDGHPLQRASVNLYETGDYKFIASTTADDDGSFAFPNLKAAGYVLEGTSPGYITSRYEGHQGFNTAIITGAGVDTESLSLKLPLRASISGRITDQSGEPIRGANVALYRENHDLASAHVNRYNGAQTDDTGAYEITDLPPGTYFLSATATPWYAIHPQPPRQTDGYGFLASVDPSLDVAYPITFYPEVTDSSQASPIVLKAGDQPEIDLRLNALPAISIDLTQPSDPNPGAPPPQGFAPPMRFQYQVLQQVFGNLEQAPTNLRVTPNGTSLAALAPGHYVLKQLSAQPDGLARSLSVNLTGQTTQVDPSQGQELANLHIQVKTAEGTTPEHSGVSLQRAGTSAVVNPQSGAKGVSQFRGLDPADYDVRVSLGDKPGFVVSLLSDGKALPSNRIHITAGSNLSLTLIAATASASLNGFARMDGKPAHGAMILLLPADPAERTLHSWCDQSDLDGSFHLLNIPPGRYSLLALDDAWDLDLQREGALDHYLPLATPITIPDHASAIKFTTPITVQPR